MANRTQNLREGRHDRARIRMLMDQGMRDSRIAKETGISYQHVKQIADQERAAMAPDKETQR